MILNSACRYGLVATIVASISGCAGISSTFLKDNEPATDGIVYFLPRKPIKITVTVDANGKETASIQAGDAVPDIHQRYILSYGKNYVGKNHSVVSITQAGLITSSNGDTTSGITQIAQNLAKAAAISGQLFSLQYTRPAPANGAPPPQCDKSQTYTTILYPEDKTTTLCDYRISASLDGGDVIKDTGTKKAVDGIKQPGIFYRRNISYTVEVSKNGVAGVYSKYNILSPDESPTYFVPVTQTLFANSNTNVALSDGVLTSVDESADGEVVALTELPADVISAYFGAIGNLFSAFSTNATNQSQAISNEITAELAKAKKKNCDDAINSNKPIADIKAACS